MAGKTSPLEIAIVMLGKTGHGKSSTGNSVLRRKAFKTSMSTESQTEEFRKEYSTYGGYHLEVVDTPGLEDTRSTNYENDLLNAILYCSKGVHVFLLAVRLDIKQTQEEKNVFITLKRIFGERCLKDHGIVVITHADVLEKNKEDKNLKLEDWIRQPDIGPVSELFQECDYRCVFFDNSVNLLEKKKALQVKQFLDLAEQLSRKGVYSSELLKKFDDERKKLVTEHPIMNESIQMKIALLRSRLDVITENISQEDVRKIEKEAYDLLAEIIKQDDGTAQLQNLQKDIEDIKNRCDDLNEDLGDLKLTEAERKIKELKAKAQFLEKYHKLPSTFWKSWKKTGLTIFSVVFSAVGTAGLGAAAALTFPLSAVAAGGALVCGTLAARSFYEIGKTAKSSCKKKMKCKKQ